jgi:hypothetical protein
MEARRAPQQTLLGKTNHLIRSRTQVEMFWLEPTLERESEPREHVRLGSRLHVLIVDTRGRNDSLNRVLFQWYIHENKTRNQQKLQRLTKSSFSSRQPLGLV